MNIFVPGILEGKAAFVTGGGGGIGAGIAKRLGEHGAKVALFGRTQAKLDAVGGEIRAAGGEALSFAGDVREYSALERALNAAAEAFGRLDVLVCSAAGNFLAPAAALSANGFRAVVDIDLCGTFNTCRAAFARLAERRGAILSITATQAFVPMPLQAHAGAAKAGIEKLTRDLALEWAAAGVRVNSLAPGPIEGTEGMARLAPGELADRMRKHVPLGRWGTIDEIADAALFLCSPAAAFVTGAIVAVDGGYLIA